MFQKSTAIASVCALLFVGASLSASDARACHSGGSKPQQELKCGDVITDDVMLSKDLDCSNFSGVPLTISGSGVKLDGRGHKLVAPQAFVGLAIRGDHHQVTNLEVSGLAQGTGIEAMDASHLKLKNNKLDHNLIGIKLFANSENMTDTQLIGNDLSSAGLFAIQVQDSGAAEVLRPVIRNNDLSRAGSYALHIDARRLVLSDHKNNDFSDSKNGIFFTGGKLSIHDLDLSASGIKEQYIMAVSAEYVKIVDSRLNAGAAADALQARFGVHAYRVERVQIENTEIRAQDVGVKISTESGVSTQAFLRDNEITDCTVAGIQLSSYDATVLGKTTITRNDLRRNPEGRAIWQTGTTQLGAGSGISQNSY